MIPVRDNSGSFHGIVAIYDSSGKEIAEVRDNQCRLLFKNWNELSSVPPLHFTSRADYLQDYRIYGNTVQNGTPTPENPVEVVGCGVRTGNLFPLDTAKLHVGRIENDGTIDYEVGTITVGTDSVSYQSDTAWRGFYTDFIQANENDQLTINTNDTPNIAYSCNCYDKNDNFLGKAPAQSTASIRTFTMLAGTKKVRINCTSPLTEYTITNLMLNTGSTALPYEPYGYKIPVTVSNGTNSVTTPVYIGSEPLHKIGDYADYADFKRGMVVRGIKKLVLTGKENFNGYSNTASGVGVTLLLSDMLPNSRINGFCTHFTPQLSPASSAIDGITFGAVNASLYITFSVKTATALNLTNTESVKTWLAARYAAGTPVTVWHVLTEPEEEPLENLLPIQTIKGSDVLTVDTTVQPSNIWIKGKIKAIN